MNNNFLIKYEYAKKMLETELDILIHSFELKHGYTPVEHMKSRIKSISSIQKKLERRGYSYTEENIEKHVTDVIGVRIVVWFLSDVYDIVSLITNSTNIILKERRDYIANPKESGYSSYHLIVRIPVYIEKEESKMKLEIQIRSLAMDFWASLEHKINYKYDKQVPKNIQKELKDCAKMTQKLDKKMSNLGKALMEEEKELLKEITAEYSTVYAGFMIAEKAGI